MTNRGTWNFFHFNRKLINFGMNDLSVQLLYKFLGHRFFFLAIIIALHFPSCFSTKLIFAKNIKNKIYIDVCIDHSIIHYWLTLSWGVFLKSFALTVHLNLSYTVGACFHMSKHLSLADLQPVTFCHTYFLILVAFSPTVVFHQKRLWCISNGKFSTHHFEERNKRKWTEFSTPDAEQIKTSHGKGISE